MKGFSFRQILVPALSLFLICLITTALLVGTNFLTKDQIAEQDKGKAESMRKIVLPDAVFFEQMEIDGVSDCYMGKDESGELVGYTFVTKQKGYSSVVTVMTGVSKDEQVKGVAILSQNETPGLGANAVKDSFQSQYKQKVPENGFSVVKNKKAGDGEIEAMTGATISSKAVTDAVNQALFSYKAVLESKGD